MKILTGLYSHESNTFSRQRTDFTLLTCQGSSAEGAEIFEIFNGTSTYLGGMIECAKKRGIELIPACAYENAGPILTAECHAFVLDKITGYARKHRGEYDGICMGLHGAGIAEGSEDIELDTLMVLRAVVGDDMPITIALDLHGNLSRELADLTQGIFGIKENPHIDCAVTGYEAMNAVIDAVEYREHAHSFVQRIPFLVPVSQNMSGIFKEVKDCINQYKKDHKLLDAAFFHGFPFADHTHCSASVFVTAYENAEAHAKELARYVWSLREQLIILERSVPEDVVPRAAEIVRNSKTGLVIINEASDNPGGGAPGDGTQLLREMLRLNLPDSAFGYMYDPAAARAAAEAGVGATISVSLGGKVEDAKWHGEPIELVDAEVCAISNGDYTATSPVLTGVKGTYGLTARLRAGNVDIVIGSVQNQTYDDRPFTVCGIDINQKRLIGLKSAQHFKAFYADCAIDILPVNTDGIHTSDLHSMGYQNIRRPMYPFDEGVTLDF